MQAPVPTQAGHKPAAVPTTVPTNWKDTNKPSRTTPDRLGRQSLFFLGFSSLSDNKKRRRSVAWCPEEDSNLHGVTR